jgi:hypothetical protein
MEVRRLYRLYTFPMIQFLGDHSRAYFKYRRQHYQSSSGANASPRLSFKANSLKNNLLIRFVVIILLVAARFAPRRFFGRREFKFSRLSEVPEIRGGNAITDVIYRRGFLLLEFAPTTPFGPLLALLGYACDPWYTQTVSPRNQVYPPNHQRRFLQARLWWRRSRITRASTST